MKQFWNEKCWVPCKSFFFYKKFQRCLANVKVLRKKKFFYVQCRLLVCFLNHEPFVKEVGTVLRTEAEIFSWVAFERMSGRRKKKFFFVKVRPRRVFHKNSGARTCLRTRPKCSQSEQTLKKRSPFVYHTQRKHGKLKVPSFQLSLEQNVVLWENFPNFKFHEN